MEENKNLNTAPETEDTAVETVKPKKEKKPKEKKPKEKKPKKEKLLKNVLLAKKGGYSIALTAIVIAAIIILNVLVSALSDRFVLEFDMTADKENSISQENIDYIKSVEQEVEVIVCATEETYATYVGSMAQQSYGISYDANANEYFAQTLKLINKYNAYNDKIKVQFVDTQSSEFSNITSTYGSDNLEYGSIIVSVSKEDGNKRYKKLGFNDIYLLQEDQTYAAYGMSMSTIVGNNVETALTGAVAYVLSDIDTKVAFLTGHSSADLTAGYKTLLENNNYKVEVVSDSFIGKISDEYDIIVIPAPSKDFMEEEINAISEFLDNDGKLGKGMMVFADASSPYLTDFYSYLTEWGAEISDGILYETDGNYHASDDNTVFVSGNTGNVTDLGDMGYCITGYNVPMIPAFESDDGKKAVSVVGTMETTVEAPKGVTSNWSGADKANGQSYSMIIETTKTDYDEDNNEIQTKVAVFASPYFLGSDYNESNSVSNKDLTLAMADRASGAGDTGISFVSKSITNESFYDSVTESSSNLVRIFFMFILPVAVIVTGIVIFVKRRNA